jgi:hypothetical protein
MDSQADVRIDGKAGETMSKVLDQVKKKINK